MATAIRDAHVLDWLRSRRTGHFRFSDDGTSDWSVEVAKEDRLRQIRFEKIIGDFNARNTAMALRNVSAQPLQDGRSSPINC